jgi:hypothetical protein
VIKRKKGVAGQGQTPPKKSSTRKDTLVRLAGQLLGLFQGRDDEIAVGNSREMRRERNIPPLTPEDFVANHLAGRICFGFYLLLFGNKVWVSCLDFDDKPHKPDPHWRKRAAKVYRLLKKYGVHALVEISQGGRGGHLWIFFDRPVSAWLVRAFWRGLIQHLEIPMLEIYPRQDTLDGKTVGNPIRYPLFNQSRFVDIEDGWKRVPPSKAMAAVIKATAKQLKSVAHKLGFRLLRSGTKATPAGASGNASGLPARVQQLLQFEPMGSFARRWKGNTDGLKDTSRSGQVFAISCSLICAYVPTDEVEAAIRHWCEIHRYEKGERDDWIEMTIDCAYKWLFESSMTRRRLRGSMAGLCDPAGPIAREFRKRINNRTQKGRSR